MSTRTYYRGPDAVVTDELFIWRGTPTTKGFVIRDLRTVGRGRGDVDQLRPYKIWSLAAALLAVAAVWNTVDRPAAYALGGLAIIVPGVLSVAGRWLQTPRWELRASYHNRQVIIYSSGDERVFNQVARGLQRAMEDARSPAGSPGTVAA